jgi:putative transcriptional regulator
MKKKTTKSTGSELVRRLKGFAEALDSAPDIRARFTCKSIKLNLSPHTYSAEMVQRSRRTLQASQAIFAQFLGVSVSAVRDWEQGIKPPSGAACRLMDEIQANPKYFRARLTAMSSPVGAEG